MATDSKITMNQNTGVPRFGGRGGKLSICER